MSCTGPRGHREPDARVGVERDRLHDLGPEARPGLRAPQPVHEGLIQILDLLARRSDELVRHRGGHGDDRDRLLLERRDVRRLDEIGERYEDHADGALAPRDVDAVDVRDARAGDHRDVALRVHALVVAVIGRLVAAAHVHDGALGDPAAAAATDALGEVGARHVGLRVAAEALQRGHRGEPDVRHLEALVVGAGVARGIEAEGLEAVGDVCGGLLEARRSGVAPAASRIGDVREIVVRPGTVELLRDGGERGHRSEQRQHDPDDEDQRDDRGGRSPGEHLAQSHRRTLEEDPQTVPREIEREDAARERGRRHERDPWREEHLGPPLREDRAPLRRDERERLPRSAEVIERDGDAAADDVAEEAELAEDQEDRARLEGRADRKKGQQVRDRMAREGRELGEALGAGRLEERPALEVDERRARGPTETPPAGDRERGRERREPRADVEGEDPEHREEQRRERGERVDQRRHDTIDPPSGEPSGDGAEGDPDREPCGEDDERERERRLRAVHDRHPKIPALPVRAERVAERARIERRRDRVRADLDE